MDCDTSGQKEYPADEASFPVVLVVSFDEMAYFPETFRKGFKALAFFGFAEFITEFGTKAHVIQAIWTG
jgi:hypothetical protein